MTWPRASATTVGFLNLGVAVLQVVAGIYGFLSILDILHLAPIFVSAYAILLALPLFLYECKFKRFHRILRRQVGFMFYFYGRCAYLVFMALMDVGIPGGLGKVIAILIDVNVFFMLSLRCCGVATGPLTAGHAPPETYHATVFAPKNGVRAARFLS
ncbi:hypothetical protein H310_14290 [Aphanomyces invadans]|uniref:Uncharacterized protein n=1 Tax=Aphanomyces invadans TaxID=157072 RepID=A0A024TA73_9STRA|nr:hypothetical protein H310_14290 [Aphanomyces invadans]ETV91050.1 hypothetical protein H310_14290 [Aphanomyces invadans]|eukprot:XP_008880330.1 hypothetical protein H310_14290 [Aphanomyces invadans]